MRPHWDIFCRVIDNYGDIGVCWRLARQLAAEFGQTVRLWADDLHSLAPLVPGIDPERAQQFCAGVEVCHWPADEFPEVAVADIVIEAFACDIPGGYLKAMARRQAAPAWINLEYLSAEPWIEDCHMLASPHPTLPLRKTFYFPGFTGRSGGLLRERDLLARRQQTAVERRAAGIDVSLFCYDTAPLARLLDAMAASDISIRCRAFAGKTADAIGRSGIAFGQHDGRLDLEVQPFVPQAEFDALLWANDINFVRGEDSFVRAQWAARPFVWHIYPQDDGAHLIKLAAFLDLYCAELDQKTAAATRAMFLAWNGAGDVFAAWPIFLERLPQLAAHACAWAEHLAQQTDLTTNLVKMFAGKV